MNNGKLNLRVLGITLVLIVFFFLILSLSYRYISPFGSVVLYQFSATFPGAQSVTNFAGEEKSSLVLPSQIIHTPISRFYLRVPAGNFESIHAKIKFKGGPKEIKLGVKGSEKDPFLYHPLYQSLLQNLNWQKVQEGNFILWQKNNKYKSLIDLIDNPPSSREIATYFADTDKLFLLKVSPQGVGGSTVIETSLRGSHLLSIRVTKAPLRIKIVKQDMNMYPGEDAVKLSLTKGNRTVLEKTIEDDGIVDGSMLQTAPQEVTLEVPTADPGVYDLNVACECQGNDSIIKKIDVNQSGVVLKSRVFVVGNKPTTLWTDNRQLDITTPHAEGIQDIKLDDHGVLKIEREGKASSFDLDTVSQNSGQPDRLHKLVFPKNDLILLGTRYFSFTKESFFSPNAIQSTDLAAIANPDQINFILTSTSYNPAKNDGNWLEAETSFSSSDIKMDGNKIYFSLEVPDLDKPGRELEVDSLGVRVGSNGVLDKFGANKPVTKDRAASANSNSFLRILSSIADAIKSLFSRGKPETAPAKQAGTKTPTPTVAITMTPTSSAPTFYSVSPSSSTSPGAVKVTILNGGAETGAATRLADKVKSSGFINVVADSLAKTDYKGITIRYRNLDEPLIPALIRLLPGDYTTINKEENATSSPEIVIILGSK